MSYRRRLALVSALSVALGVSPLAGHGVMRQAGPSLSESQMQALSSEAPTWHPDDTVVYDAYGRRHYVESRRPPARDFIILPEDATNEMTPAEASRITGHVDSAAGPPLTGSEEQAGNMGPNSAKGQ